MRYNLRKHWFLTGLLCAIFFGFMFRNSIAPLASLTWFRSLIVAVVIFSMGLLFSMRSIVNSIRSPRAAVFAIAINALVTPVIAAVFASVLPAPLAGGLIVASIVPCTLASASIWTRRAGGDDGVSMMVTVVTNLFCFVIAPASLLLLLGKSNDERIFWQQVTKLIYLVVVPLMLAQVFRSSSRVVLLTSRYATTLANISQFGILLMVVLGIASTSNLDTGPITFQLVPFVIMIGMTLALHLASLTLGYHGAALLGLARSQQIAVAIAGSQKTLMVGLQIAIDCGVSLFPMISYHIIQLVVDTILADRWSAASSESEAHR